MACLFPQQEYDAFSMRVHFRRSLLSEREYTRIAKTSSHYRFARSDQNFSQTEVVFPKSITNGGLSFERGIAVKLADFCGFAWYEGVV